MIRHRLLAAALALVVSSPAIAAPAKRADAPAGECHFVDVDFVPAKDLQIVAWIEDTHGTYVDTAYITQATGSFGIGNRPGRFDFNSAPQWPYGRRITTFPVWAHRHGLSFPEVEFQDGEDSNLSHSFDDSSHETHFCRPLLPQEFASDADAMTCPSAMAFTDKGTLSTSKTSQYPPRTDVVRQVGTDSGSVDQYATLNPFDGVSQATPAGGVDAQLSWTPPASVGDGDYVLWVEVSKETDMNGSYNETVFPPPDGIAYANYGEAYRGQPSVVYRVPFTIGGTDSIGSSDKYVGYGDPVGNDGDLRLPDPTITTDVPGSGASRLQLVAGDGGVMYRVRAHARVEHDAVAPDAVSDVQITPRAPALVASFVAPGDDGAMGKVASYDIRLAAGAPITEATFASAPRVAPPASLVAGGEIQELTLTGLLPDTDYSLAIRPIDDCHNAGPLTVTAFHTDVPTGEVDACFVATAAYGSVMAADVGMLRHFRDVMLKRSALGELFVETYYTFGPPVAHVVGESELLRASARDVLDPLVQRVRAIVF